MRKTSVVAVAAAAVLSVPQMGDPAEAAAAIRFGVIQYDPSGADSGSNAHLNQEWVTIRNTGAKPRRLTGWPPGPPIPLSPVHARRRAGGSSSYRPGGEGSK